MPENVTQEIGLELNIEYLPVPNLVALNLLETVMRDECSFEDIGEIVEPDASLCSQILRLANSAYFGFRKEVSTLERAIMLIGVEEVRNLSLALCLINQFKKIPTARSFDLKLFWTHSLLSSFCAKKIAEKSEIFDKDLIYIMALLHDLGRLIMAMVVPEKFEAIALIQREKGTNFWDIEKEFKITHTSLGKIIAKRWNLPREIEESMEFHHEPSKSRKFFRECSVVHVANFISKKLEDSFYVNTELPLPESKILLLSGIDYEGLEKLLTETKELKEHAETLSDLLIGVGV